MSVLHISYTCIHTELSIYLSNAVAKMDFHRLMLDRKLESSLLEDLQIFDNK